MAAKAYEVRSFLDNQDAYDAMNIPRVFRELFIQCGETWEEGSAPLRACLVEISNSWHELGLPGDCPFIFEEEYTRKHELQFEECEEWHHVQEFAREYLDTDTDGWIPQKWISTRSWNKTKLCSTYSLRKCLLISLQKRYARCGHSLKVAKTTFVSR